MSKFSWREIGDTCWGHLSIEQRKWWTLNISCHVQCDKLEIKIFYHHHGQKYFTSPFLNLWSRETLDLKRLKENWETTRAQGTRNCNEAELKKENFSQISRKTQSSFNTSTFTIETFLNRFWLSATITTRTNTILRLFCATVKSIWWINSRRPLSLVRIRNHISKFSMNIAELQSVSRRLGLVRKSTYKWAQYWQVIEVNCPRAASKKLYLKRQYPVLAQARPTENELREKWLASNQTLYLISRKPARKLKILWTNWMTTQLSNTWECWRSRLQTRIIDSHRTSRLNHGSAELVTGAHQWSLLPNHWFQILKTRCWSRHHREAWIEQEKVERQNLTHTVIHPATTSQNNQISSIYELCCVTLHL